MIKKLNTHFHVPPPVVLFYFKFDCAEPILSETKASPSVLTKLIKPSALAPLILFLTAASQV